jgi:alpha,alpha-trehalase
MHEKYNAFVPGERGSGGEYLPETGFGWTNGVALDFLDRFCHD